MALQIRVVITAAAPYSHLFVPDNEEEYTDEKRMLMDDLRITHGSVSNFQSFVLFAKYLSFFFQNIVSNQQKNNIPTLWYLDQRNHYFIKMQIIFCRKITSQQFSPVKRSFLPLTAQSLVSRRCKPKSTGISGNVEDSEWY